MSDKFFIGQHISLFTTKGAELFGINDNIYNGRVMFIYKKMVGVSFDNEIPNAVTLGGRCPDHHGWWFINNELEQLIKESVFLFEI